MSDDFEDADRRSGPEPFVDQREQPTRVGLICPDLRGQPARHSIEARQGEFEGLAKAIRVEVVFSEVVNVRDIRPATFLGSGTVESIARKVAEGDVELLLFDAALSPVQQRNLETQTKAKVLDRTGLILEIFGERAATREGVLQVELAHLNYQKGRLVRSWTHLERQRGGFGFLGGPGETQIETDRRLLQERIALLEERLEKVKKTRAQQRGGKTSRFPAVALVGYTNSGKSTLFNTLTGAGVFARNLLFATLDTTLRKLTLPDGREVMLSDTVGFVSELPHDLVAAFRATLEEVVEADLILHVRDVANPDHAAQAADVIGVLNELGVPPDKPLIEVWNKVDLLPRQTEGGPGFVLAAEPAGKVAAVVQVSALTGEGLDTLLRAIETVLGQEARTYRVHVPFAEGADVGWLYGHAQIVSTEPPDETGTTYEVRVDPRFHAAFAERFAGRIAE